EEGKKLGKREVLEIENEISSGFLEVKNVKDSIHIEHIGKGELEVLSYAHQKGLPCIIDDKKARQICVSLNVKALPISSFMIWGVKKKQGKEVLNDMIKKGYRLKSDVYIEILESLRKLP
ncbi:MAG: hypothetical protein V3R93_02410, partial [Candidatus Hydrothermarchaeaceae archaeon]